MPDNLEPGWLWMIGGILLLIAEVIAPGFFLVFIGAAALATGAFTLLFDLGRSAHVRKRCDREQRPTSQRPQRPARGKERHGHRSGRRAFGPGPGR